VLKALGFEQDKQDRKKWRHDASIIGVGEGAKASKWFDYTADVGKGGAIDLVSHCMGTDFKGGLAWLADRFGPGAAAADLTAQIEAAARDQVKLAAQERPAFAPPAPDPEKWPEVRAYLVKERVISTALIDGMHERGKVYADARANAVFPQLAPDGKTVTGAEVKGTRPRADGTRFAGLALGSHRAAGLFRLLTHAAAQTVYLAEAAIDAVSLFSRLRRAGETNFAVVSAAGVAQRTPSLVAKLWPGARKVCAFDADLAGDKAAAALKVEGWERLRPVGAKDWNAVALIEASASRGEPPQPQQRRVELDRDSGPSFQ
jgi:hypothetical protein